MNVLKINNIYSKLFKSKTITNRLFSSVIPSTIEKSIEPQILFNLSSIKSTSLRPVEVVAHLDNYIVGQTNAKKAVAISLRNRWRRLQLPEELRNEVIPKNILMIGPTGCGKTEIARRIAKLSDAPFIKVEATKFTEVGFHGKDVDQIIKDLLDISISMTKKKLKNQFKDEVKVVVDEILLTCLLGEYADSPSKDSFASLLQSGQMEDRLVEIEIPIKTPEKPTQGNTGDQPNAAFVVSELFKMAKGNNQNKKTERKKLPISEARPLITEVETEKLLENYDVIKEAIHDVEQNGIVFLDEIDKLVSSSDYRGADASSEGVQRDLLPLIEGSAITTKHGNVNTDFILFICSGAFHSSKPSDLLAELQGRLPIRVNLTGLTQEDLYSILTKPVTNLIRQQIELMKTENVELSFTDVAIKEIARIAFDTNKTIENIGARRLHTVIERIMEDISFDAADRVNEEENKKIIVTDEYVKSKIGDLILKSDMKRYIL